MGKRARGSKPLVTQPPERRFGTHIYPGTDSVILAFLENELAERLQAEIRQLKLDKVKAHTRLALFPVELFL